MATVVLDSNPAWQACLRVDDDGYLMVTGVGGGSSTVVLPPPTTQEQETQKEIVRERVVEKIVEVVRTEVKEVVRTLTKLPSDAELDALLAQRQEALRAEAAKQAAGADLTPKQQKGLIDYPLGASFAFTPGAMVFKKQVTQGGGATHLGGSPSKLDTVPASPTVAEAAAYNLTQAAMKELALPSTAKRFQLGVSGVDPYLTVATADGGINPVYLETWFRIECVQPVAGGNPSVKVDWEYINRYLENAAAVGVTQPPRKPLGDCPFNVPAGSVVRTLQADVATPLPKAPGEVSCYRYGTPAAQGKFLLSGYTPGWNYLIQTTDTRFKVSIFTRASYTLPPTGDYGVLTV